MSGPGWEGFGASDPGEREPEPAADATPPRTAPVIIDTRRYQRMIAAFGILLVLAFSVYLWAQGGGSTSPGIPAGQRLPRFVAPLATANLQSLAANPHPVCNPTRPARRGLNVCDRRPLVLAFFALSAPPCIRQVDALQALKARFPSVQFAAVALNASKAATARLVRRQHWTIPIAYDLTGVIGQLYGVEVCPLLEVARADGTVTRRLIGEHWLTARALAPVLAALTG
jgi:hypothetical protein